ncbi:hypothetical protein QL285_087773 [Trifolium repens]|nr:hypothetical protein QL285_087773 [Trifolium repens]
MYMLYSSTSFWVLRKLKVLNAVEKWDFEPKRQNHVYPFCNTRSASSDSPWRAHQMQPLYDANFICSVNSNLEHNWDS